MPTPDEIIESFKAAASKETWASTANDPGGVAMNKALNDLRDLLNETDPNQHSVKAFAFMESNKTSPAAGTATCQALLEKGPLTESIATVTDVAKRVMSAELSRYQPSAGGFIRSNHAINGLTKQFIQETSPDCQTKSKQQVDDLVKKYGDSIKEVGATNDWTAKSVLTTKLGKDMVGVMVDTPLSQESVGFLKELRDTIEQDQGYVAKHLQSRPKDTPEQAKLAQLNIAEVVVNNNAALRFTGPLFQQATPENNQLWKDATAAALSTFSGARKETMQAKVKHSPTGEGGKPLTLTPEQLQENDYSTNVAKGVHEVRDMVLEMQEKYAAGSNSVNLAAQKHRESLELESALKPRVDQLALLKQKNADLNKAISVEKIKAFFSAKGIKGAKQEVGAEIARTENSIKESRGQLDTRFKNLKADQDYERALDQLAKKQGINPKDIHTALQMPGVSKALMEFARKEHNSENLEFLQAVGEFNKLAASGASIEQLRNAADDIRKTFVTTGSPKEINISATDRAILENNLDKLGTSKPTEQSFESWGPETRKGYGEVFIQTDDTVVGLVRDDTFKRFKTDPSFKDAVTKSAEPPVPKVGQTSGIDQRNSVKVEGPSLGVKSSKVGVG